jgi:hypothetical protein
MSDQKKTKAQLIEELEASRGEVTDLRGENTDLREKVAGVDVSAVERQLAVERVRTEAMNMRSTEDLRRVVAVLFQGMLDLGIEILGPVSSWSMRHPPNAAPSRCVPTLGSPVSIGLPTGQARRVWRLPVTTSSSL